MPVPLPVPDSFGSRASETTRMISGTWGGSGARAGRGTGTGTGTGQAPNGPFGAFFSSLLDPLLS